MHQVSRNSMILGVALILAMHANSVAESPSNKRETFDISRFSNEIEGWFSPFYVTETKPIQAVLAARMIRQDTQVLVTETAAGKLALLTEQMAYHHIAQGVVNGKAWMATFCVVCNTGVSMIPTFDGKEQFFEAVGLYNGLMVMKDLLRQVPFGIMLRAKLCTGSLQAGKFLFRIDCKCRPKKHWRWILK